MLLGRLREILEEKPACEEKTKKLFCKVIVDLPAKIFDTENNKGKQLLKKHGMKKHCDCVVLLLESKLVLVIEILCGELIPKELESKKKQVITWRKILQQELTKAKVLCFIIFFKHSLEEFQRQQLNLRRKGIFLEQFKRSKFPHIKLTELLKLT
jgi:hypothetical protein